VISKLYIISLQGKKKMKYKCSQKTHQPVIYRHCKACYLVIIIHSHAYDYERSSLTKYLFK